MQLNKKKNQIIQNNMSEHNSNNEESKDESTEKKDLMASDLTEEQIKAAVMGESSLGNVNSGETFIERPVHDDIYLQNAREIQEQTGKQGLGNVKELHGETKSGINSDMVLGWFPLYLDDMPSSGRFYHEGMTIHIRAARAAEIRHWSTLNERDMWDVDDKLNHIMQNCTRIQSDKKMLSWKDILEEDRIHVILAIRDLTFKEGENKLQITKQCPSCGTTNTIDIKNANFQRSALTPEIEKYYDEIEKQYAIQTKSYGTIKMKPPTIGVMQIVTKYIAKKQQEGGYWDQSYIQLFPYLHPEWRGLKEDAIFNGEVDFQGWGEKKYMLMYRICEKMKVGVQPEITTECTGCAEEVVAQVNFRDGVKAIFIPTISNISDELL